MADHVRGTAVDIQNEAQAVHETGLGGILHSGDLPLLARVVTDDDLEFDLDRLMEFGLQRLLDGLAPLLEGRGRP